MSAEQANITVAISNWDQYRILALRLSTHKHWEGRLETADGAAQIRNKLNDLLKNIRDVSITSTLSRFLIKKH